MKYLFVQNLYFLIKKTSLQTAPVPFADLFVIYGDHGLLGKTGIINDVNNNFEMYLIFLLKLEFQMRRLWYKLGDKWSTCNGKRRIKSKICSTVSCSIFVKRENASTNGSFCTQVITGNGFPMHFQNKKELLQDCQGQWPCFSVM